MSVTPRDEARPRGARPILAPVAGARRAATLLAVSLLAGTALASCASLDADVHLAPLYTRGSTAGGGSGTEALGGMWVSGRRDPDGPLDGWALRPFVGWQREPDGPVGPSDEQGANAHWRAEILHPLGRVTSGLRTSSSWVFPLWSWQSREAVGGGRRWTLLTLPGLWMAKENGEWESFAVFPVGGHVEDFVTYDSIDFALFPLWSRAKRGETTSQHWLYPFFGWSFGGGERSWHLFPFWVHGEIDGFYERDSYLWPFVHVQENDKHLGEENVERRWMVWPLLGKRTKGTYTAWTTLWPLFGWATDPREDYWAVDLFWFLVRIQSGGENPQAEERTRVWPFYSHFEGDRLESWNVMWPLYHRRQERYPFADRDSTYVFPFWQSWKRTGAETGEESSWQKLWPFYQLRDERGVRRFSSLAPFPFHWDARFDFYWAWPFELWASHEEEAREIRREHGWLGLWRREKDAREDRRSFTGLWGRRTYREDGRLVNETSLLFGLLRWKSMEGGGGGLLAPAFPGPGWPAERSDERLAETPGGEAGTQP